VCFFPVSFSKNILVFLNSCNPRYTSFRRMIFLSAPLRINFQLTTHESFPGSKVKATQGPVSRVLISGSRLRCRRLGPRITHAGVNLNSEEVRELRVWYSSLLPISFLLSFPMGRIVAPKHSTFCHRRVTAGGHSGVLSMVIVSFSGRSSP